MRFFLHCFFWVIIFFEGLFQLLSIPSFLYKPLFPLIPALLFLVTLYQRFESIKLPAFLYVFLFLLISIVSSIANGMNSFKAFYFLSYLLYPILYFYVLINDRNLNFGGLFKLIIILILLQISASLIKLAILGISESGAIGTMSTDSGSLSAIFPLFIISFLLPIFYKTNHKIYVLLIGLFTLFGIIGEKRALFIVLPLLILYSLLTYSVSKSFKLKKRVIKSWSFIFCIGIILLYCIVSASPSLNPENKIGGSFDTEYLYNYTTDYTDSSDKSFKEMRRLAGLMYFTDYVTSSLQTFLVGDGAGKLVKSSFIPGEGTILENYGVRYGGRMAFIWMALQVGLLGVVLFLLIHFKLFLSIRQRYMKSRNDIFYIGYTNLIFVLVFDFFFYSSVSIQADVIYCLFMFVVAFLYRDNESFPYLKS